MESHPSTDLRQQKSRPSRGGQSRGTTLLHRCLAATASLGADRTLARNGRQPASPTRLRGGAPGPSSPGAAPPAPTVPARFGPFPRLLRPIIAFLLLFRP